MTEMFTAGPAPDAKSAAAPSGAAHSYPSTEDEEETSRPASQTGSRYVTGLTISAVHKLAERLAQPGFHWFSQDVRAAVEVLGLPQAG